MHEKHIEIENNFTKRKYCTRFKDIAQRDLKGVKSRINQ
jgi:hypothetical protein